MANLMNATPLQVMQRVDEWQRRMHQEKGPQRNHGAGCV